MYIDRKIEEKTRQSLRRYPVVAIIGARQCGKSTLSKVVLKHNSNVIFLDLERPSDLNKLQDAEWFFSSQKQKQICIDEIQRKPELFPLLRSLVDEWDRPGAFLVLGSASRDLLMQSSETLAGRISYLKLTPFFWEEIKEQFTLNQYIVRGGFPRSLLAEDDEASFEWRENFITTFLERDLLQWSGFTPVTMRRLWQMLAHLNGQTSDYSKLAKSLNVSIPTIKKYIDLLESTFMLEILPAYFSNSGKRLIKAPKIYIADSGITAALSGLNSLEEMMGHPSIGGIWEQIVLTNLKANYPKAVFNFYRTSNGAEIDIVMTLNNSIFAIECKNSLSPSLSKGFYFAIEDIYPTHSFIVTPVDEGWPIKKGIDVIGLNELTSKIEEFLK